MSLLDQQQNGRGYATIGPDVPLLRPPDSNKVNFPQNLRIHKFSQLFSIFQCRVVNYSLVVITFVLVLATLVSAIVYNKTSSTGVNIFFLVCILLSCLSNILLVSMLNFTLLILFSFYFMCLHSFFFRCRFCIIHVKQSLPN